MRFSIKCADGTELNGDTDADQDFRISKENGVLTFLDAPEGDKRHATALSPSAWTKVTYIERHRTGRAAFVG